MKVVVEMDVDWDGQDEQSTTEQLGDIRAMIESGAESFNFDVRIHHLFESPVGTLLDVPKPIYNFDECCASCKFLATSTNTCRMHDKRVEDSDAKCEDWRYFG